MEQRVLGVCFVRFMALPDISELMTRVEVLSWAQQSGRFQVGAQLNG